MNINYRFLLFTMTIFVMCCSKKENPVPEEEMTVIEDEVPTDPLYARLDENSNLEDYWEVFREDAIRSGRLDPGQDKTVTLFFGNEPDFASGVTPDHAGRVYSVCNDEAVSFEIIQSYWEDYTIV